MKLTHAKLKEIIKAEMDELLIKPEDDEVLEACGDDKPGQRYHSSSSGKFTSPEKEDTCWALPGCGRSRTKKGSKKRYAISSPQTSGRRPDRTHKCSINEPIKERLSISRKRLMEIIREEVLSEIMPKKTASEKRAVRREYDEETKKDAARERMAPKNSLHDEIEKQMAPLRSLAHGITEDDDENASERRIEKYYNDATDKIKQKEKIVRFKKKYCEPCPPCKGTTVGDIARNIDAVSRALKGKLSEPPKN